MAGSGFYAKVKEIKPGPNIEWNLASTAVPLHPKRNCVKAGSCSVQLCDGSRHEKSIETCGIRSNFRTGSVVRHASAPAPAVPVPRVVGETIEIVSAVAKLSGAAKAVCAASAIQITPRMTSENGCLINEVNTDVVGECYFLKSVLLRPGAALGEVISSASLALLADAIGPQE